MTITDTTTVADIATAVPASVRVFQQHGIDFCCGGKRPLAQVCEEQGLSFTEVTGAIAVVAEARTSADREWTREPLGALIDHIVTTYHDKLREELPRLEAMATKVAHVHGAKAPFLAQVQDIVAELSADMNEHMHKEEMVLFPAIRALEEGAARHGAWIQAPISVMEQEHDQAAALVAQLRELSGSYVAPEWACGTFRALYAGLAELESELHVHVHLENNVLFPRALNRSTSEPAGAATSA